MKIIIASLNPVKQAATRHAFEQVFPEAKPVVASIAVPSGVRDQPMTDAETLLGARQRAQRAQHDQPHADFWVGLEGGVADAQGLGMHAFGWMCVRTDSREHSARSASFPLPRKAVAALKAGRELGPVMDGLFHANNTKHKGGAVGLLTNGLVSREALYVQPLIFALIPFLHEPLF